MLRQIPSDVQQTHAELAGPDAHAAGTVLDTIIDGQNFIVKKELELRLYITYKN